MAGLRGAGSFPSPDPQTKTRHVPDNTRASSILSLKMTSLFIGYCWCNRILSGPAAQGDSQERCIQHIEETPCFGPFNAATKLHHLPRQKTEPSMMSLQLFYTTLGIIRGFHQSRTGACRQEPGLIQRKAIPKRIVINVGQAKRLISCAAPPVTCPIRRSISPFPPEQYLLFSVAVTMGEVAKGEYLQCQETGGPESPLDQPDELLNFRRLSRWPEVESGGVRLLESSGTRPRPSVQILLQLRNDLLPEAVVDSFLPTQSQVKDLDG